MKKFSHNQLTLMANSIRALSMDAVQQANSGHPGMPLGMADVATVLFTQFLKFSPKHPDWYDRDRFVLSAGHGSMLLYSLLHLTGYEDMTLEEIKNFRQLHSKAAGHPEFGDAAGIETTTGPLGQGFANGVGMALAEQLLRTKFGDNQVNHKTYALVGDGCLMEGISHEAASFAGHHKLKNLVVLFDDNNISIDGETDLSVSDDHRKRFESYGWNVFSADGHDFDAISNALEKAQKSEKPSLIAFKTTIGKGSPNKAGTSGAHGSPLGVDEIKLTKETLGWNHGPFEMPDEVLELWRSVSDTQITEPSAALAAQLSDDLPHNWETQKATIFKMLKAQTDPLATRKCSELVLNELFPVMENMLGGSADLTGSNNTKAKGMSPITEGANGNYVHYGVREHAMAAIMNGVALHKGFIPYGGTFLVFTDYCRPSIRLSAIMGQRVIYVMTHDSIGLGEDGTTHQPIEHLASLRAMPNLNVFRPADLTETADAWFQALEAKNTPSVIVLTRQNVPQISNGKDVEKGAYIIKESKGIRDLNLLATGSEVAIALDVQKLLEKENIQTAVVSMPCWEIFENQPDQYKQKVLGGLPCFAIEAASPFGWERFTRDRANIFGIDCFGLSAPAKILYNHFRLTPEDIANDILSKCKRIT